MGNLTRKMALEELENAKRAVSYMQSHCGEASIFVLQNALQCFAADRTWHTSDDDIDEACIWLTALIEAGFNDTLAEFDALAFWEFPQDGETVT